MAAAARSAPALWPERTLPLHVPITAGESLDSWLEHVACRYGAPVRLILPLLGVAWHDLRGDRQHLLARAMDPEVLRRMERQGGLPAGRLDSAVLESFDPLGWKPLHGSRFCPACLAQSDGRWQLAWRLPWTFACSTHRLLLPDRCPDCRRIPKRAITANTGLHPLAICGNLQRRGQICTGELTACDTVALADDDPRLASHHWITQRLERAGCRDQPDNTAQSELRDLQAVGTWVRLRSTREDYTAFGSATVDAYQQHLALRRDGHHPHEHAFTDSLLVSAVAGRVIDLLDADSAEAMNRLRQLPAAPARHEPARPGCFALTVGPVRLAALSARTQHRLLSAIGPSMSPADQLRYRTCTPNPGLRDTADDRARHIPQALWPEWTLRFKPRTGHLTDTIQMVMPCALLLPGTAHLTGTAAVAELRERWPHYLNTTLSRIVDAHGSAVLTAICRLADHLDQHGCPIDYRRRRHTFHGDELTDADWRSICHTASSQPGRALRLRSAQRYVFTLLTGSDLSDQRHRLAFESPAARTRYWQFAEGLTTSLRIALTEHATQLLHDHGIDEPLTWAPPGRLVSDLTLPGVDPDDIDLDALRQLTVDEGKPAGDAARQLGTSIDHIRLALQRIDRPPQPATVRDTSPRSADLRLPQALRRFHDVGMSLQQAMDETGLTRRTIIRRAKEAGITFPDDRHPAPPRIHETWLREQYEGLHHSTSDIAATLGTTQHYVLKALRAYGIAVRANSIFGHHSVVLNLDESIPAIVRAAAHRQPKAWQRLRRFQQIAPHRSLTQAARHIGAHPSTLIMQLGRLEHDIGTQLIVRGTPYQPMTLTSAGHELLQALELPVVRLLVDRFGNPPAGWSPSHPLRQRAA